MAIGKDDNGIIELKINTRGVNKYLAMVKLYGVEGNFDVQLDKQGKLLVFVSKVTKASWKIKKF